MAYAGFLQETVTAMAVKKKTRCVQHWHYVTPFVASGPFTVLIVGNATIITNSAPYTLLIENMGFRHKIKMAILLYRTYSIACGAST